MRIILAILLLASTASTHEPIGESKWDLGNGRRAIRIGEIHNYDSLGTWREIDLNLHVNGAGFIINWSNALKTTIDSSGIVVITYTHDDIDYTAIQELKFLRLYRRSDSAYFTIDNTPNWNNISVIANTVTWLNVFPGVKYTLTIGPARVTSTIYYSPTFLDSMTVLLGQRPDSNDIYLANISEYTLSASIDGHDQHLGDVRKRIFKRWGRRTFGLGKESLRYSGWDNPGVDEIPVWQRYAIVNSRLFVGEAVKCLPMRDIHVANPTATIWHNADVTIRNGDLPDTYIEKYAATTNYGTNDRQRWVEGAENPDTHIGLADPNLSAIAGGSTIDSVQYRFLSYWSTTGIQAYFHELNTAFVEDEATWTIPSTGNNWIGGGIWTNADESSKIDSLDAVLSSETQEFFASSPDGEGLCEAVQKILDGSIEGVVIHGASGSNFDVYTNNETPTNRRPTLYIEYTAAGVTTAAQFISIGGQ